MEETDWRDQLTEIVQTIPAGVVIYNTKGQFMFANPEAARIIGLEPSAIIGRSFDDPGWKVMTLDGRTLRREERTLIRVIETGKPVFGVESAIERPDGTQVIVSVNGSPLINIAGAISAIVVSFLDISALVSSQQQLERLREQKS